MIDRSARSAKESAQENGTDDAKASRESFQTRWF
jgi:hypothetical protein